VDVELERLVSEVEAANTGVARAARATRERVEAKQKRIEEERQAWHRTLAAQVDEAVAQILADAEHDVAVRRAHRERWLREHLQRGDALLDRAAATLVDLLRNRPRKKTL
jgi:hypothetical protein